LKNSAPEYRPRASGLLRKILLKNCFQGTLVHYISRKMPC
jgi:hypothetical protein